MDFLKRFLKNVLPVNQIIKFIIKQFLSSYLVIKENDLEEKAQDDSGLKNLININDLELNVSNINQKHLLHSPIKLLRGKLGKFSLDITEENKIIISIEDVSIDLMPIFNYYKKYQETIFDMKKKKEEVKTQCELENKNSAGVVVDKTEQTNPKNQNNYMLNMANKLLTNLEINVKNISIKLFTYEIGQKIMENPVFSIFIMKVNVFKNEKNEKKENLVDPNTNQPFEEIFLNNLVINVDKLCLKIDQNLNEKDNREFKELKNFCDNEKLTKIQEEKILSFFIAYNTIFAMNYKKGPCLSIKLNTKARIEKHKDIEKIVEDMNIQIDIFEAESIITPHQLFNIQILSQISNFIFTLNKNTPNKEDEIQQKKSEDKNYKYIPVENENEKKDNKEEVSSSEVSNKDKEEKLNNNDKKDLKVSYLPFENKEEYSNNNLEKKEKKNIDILGHEISKFNITMNAIRIILVLLENNNNESIPKLFSFLMEDEFESQKKNNKNTNTNLIDFDKSNKSFENYYCYYEDNILFLKIESIKSVNNETNSSINVSSVIAEYIKPNIIPKENKNKKDEKTVLKKKQKNSQLEASIYESMNEYDDFHEVGSDNEDMFESALENTEFLVMENYHKYISKFIVGEYTSNKFEIFIINEINFDMTKNILDIKEILINLNYIIILLYIKLFNQVNFFIDTNKPMYKNEDFIMSTEDIEENLNVNLEKKINDSELQLLKNLEKNNKNKKSSNKNNNNKEEENIEISVDDSIDYSEEEKNKKNGMKINLKYISIKIYNITKHIRRFDTNIYYYKLFLELIYPNISTKIDNNFNEHYEEQSLNDLISKDFIQIVLNDMNMNFYSVSNTSKINIIFQEILFKYWNYIVIQYTNISKKNKIDENPNVAITTPGNDIIIDFSDKIRINLEKNILDDLLNFNNTFLYGLSMYQIFDKYCGDLYNNKIINLFDMFGIKSHYVLLKKLNSEEYIPLSQNNNINKEKNKLEEIKKELNNKPSISIGGRIASCVININKNGTFEEKEGNLMKIKIVNIGVNLEMFNDDNNGNEKKEPLYNNVTIGINNIYFLVKEHTIPKEGKAKYYNIFSKNKIPKFESTDYFSMSFKFRNIKKIKENIIIEEEENETISDNENENENEKNEKEGSLKKKNNKFEINNLKISLSPKTKEYIAFLLNNQIKLDNMEMVIDIKISELVIDSFYHKLYLLSSTLSDFFIEFTTKKEEKNIEGTYLQSSDLIPLCEDRLMIIKLDFNINHLFLDIFLKEDKDQKNWMRLLLLVDKFKFTFNETGIFLYFNNNYIYIMKDFNYIYHIKSNNINNNNNLFDVEDKISDIHKEDSYLKRLGYVELFYNDKIKLEKTEKESNVNLGNINLFLCKDSFDFIQSFIEIFNENYLEKIKEIFSQDTLNSDDSNEEIEKQDINKQKNNKEKKEEKKKEENKKEDKNKKEEKIKEKKDNEFVNDFEVVDDIFFMDNIKKNEDKSKKNPKSKYLEKNSNTLRTIPEEDSLKSKKSNEEFNDDFTIIETKSSLERNNLRKKREEESIKYLLELDSLRLYIFSGSDFNFEDDKKNDLDLTDVQNQENKEKDQNDKEDQDDIDKNYLFKYSYQKKPKNKKILQINKRKKIEERDYKNYILLNIINLSFKIIGFYYFDFIVDNFFIDDNFDKSQYNKIISKQDYSRDSKFLVWKFEISPYKEVNKNKNVAYLRIYLNFPSLDILVDQLTLTFIIKFILSRNYDKNKENKDKENDDTNNDKNNKDSQNEDDIKKINSKDSWEDEDLENDNDLLIFVNNISINSFMINFHYNSHKISYKKLLSNGEWIEFLSGLADIKDLNINFKKYTKNIQTPLNDIIHELISLWKDDILQNQLADSILRGLTITRPFYKLYDGIKDLVVQPYLSYKKNEGIKKGFKKGMKSFFVSFSSQGLLFGEKIFRGMKIVAFRKTKLSLKKKSLYKRWVYKINKKQHEYEMHYYK